MRRLILISTLFLISICAAKAQNINIGERVPELKISTWLSGQQSAVAPLTYIEFYHSTSKTSRASLDHLKNLSNQLGTKLAVIIVTQENNAQITATLNPYLSNQICVGIDLTGKSYTNFGVSFVPFGVLIDAKRRALWLGNTLQLTPEFISKIEQ
ncbi:MAG: hypothetical protein RRZ83_05315 [Alistipes sp.]